MFLSGTKRKGPLELPKSKIKSQFADDNPPLGSYNMNQNTIGETVKKKKEGSMTIIYTNPKLRKSAAVPFSTKTKRFIDKKPDENEMFLGPGYYEHKSFVGIEKVMTGNKSQCFLSAVIFNTLTMQAPRFSENNVNTPGPGAYTGEDITSGWFKRSYNMIFAE